MMNIEMKDYSRIAAIVVAIPLLVGAVYLLSDGRTKHVEATIVNLGPCPMEDVIVHVTGNQHTLGSLGVGASATARVSPRGESHIEISYSRKGKPNRLVVDCYCEPGYTGRISAEVEDNTIKRLKNNIELGGL